MTRWAIPQSKPGASGGSDSLGLDESFVVLSGDGWTSIRVRALPPRGSTEWRKLCFDFSLFLAGSCSYRGCRGSFSCLCFSSWDETVRLIWGRGGAIPRNKYRSSTLVGLRHPEMALQAAFRTGSIFEACDDLLQTGDAYSAEEKQSHGCGADSSGICSPIIGVCHLLEDAVPDTGLCLGLSNVVFVREASV